MSEDLQAACVVAGVIGVAILIWYLIRRWALDGWTVAQGLLLVSAAALEWSGAAFPAIPAVWLAVAGLTFVLLGAAARISEVRTSAVALANTLAFVIIALVAVSLFRAQHFTQVFVAMTLAFYLMRGASQGRFIIGLGAISLGLAAVNALGIAHRAAVVHNVAVGLALVLIGAAVSHPRTRDAIAPHVKWLTGGVILIGLIGFVIGVKGLSDWSSSVVFAVWALDGSTGARGNSNRVTRDTSTA